ncbi:hypothetical protein PHYPSEUDO_000153 [Phytophthora pseudosyringae]|uniref:Jacalin-type lectin domain-containing protein n=1 Tax=Phytophthora pseudosyringae TaxID=221518 RepID=A0A8T1WKN3_9STRA|nr:hypothetical protein PHYPSEUDO_000153 [Phytophthora pseudosyringae]
MASRTKLLGETVTSITIRSGARVDGITLEISKPTVQTFTHGYSGVSDNMNTLQLSPGEYITYMEAHWDKNEHTDDHTRVFYLKSSRVLAIRSREGYKPTPRVGPGTVAPAKIPVSGDGSKGDPGSAQPSTVPVDSSTSTSSDSNTSSNTIQSPNAGSTASADSSTAGSTIEFPVGTSATGSTSTDDASNSPEPPSTTAPEPSGPATPLSETFGGPHGTKFSDQALATSGQTVSSIAIRAGARIDGITLTVTAPTAQTFAHGYDGVATPTMRYRLVQESTSPRWKFTGRRTATLMTRHASSIWNLVRVLAAPFLLEPKPIRQGR